MENVIYIDCFSGISGDMMLGALIDLGLDFNFLRDELARLDLKNYELNLSEEKAGPVRSKKFSVVTKENHHHRNFKHIKEIIINSSLSEEVKSRSVHIFGLIAAAEAKVHQEDIEKIHFHEVGAVDSIIDIVGISIALEKLNIKKLHSSPVPLGSGKVNTQHGILPVPAPATLEILKDVPVYGGDFDFEVTTPTGAAFLKSAVEKFGPMLPMDMESVGYGRGNKEGTVMPNLLRLVKGKLTRSFTGEKGGRGDKLAILSANIDDINPEILGFIMEKLFEAEALDVWFENIQMKKNRPGIKLNIICSENKIAPIIEIIFTETTTFGIRKKEIERFTLSREIKIAKLPYGDIEVKIGFWDGKRITVSPEYESCKKMALKTGKPLKEIYQEAILFFSNR